MTRTGGCLCGSLRYAAEGEPRSVGKCYCTDCQKETGTGHMTFAVFAADAVSLSGDASRYVRTGDSGHEVDRVFCPSCGTTVVGFPKGLGPVAAVRAGTLDDPSGLSAKFAVYGRSAQPWDAPPADIKVYNTVPQR